MIREVVILTMSSKNHGYCVAGIDLQNGEWIRLVSDDADTHGALSKEDVRYSDGGCCKPLDVVRVAIDQYTPIEHQPENALIDSTKYLKKNWNNRYRKCLGNSSCGISRCFVRQSVCIYY